MANQQTICFINPRKFVSLSGNTDLRNDREFLDSELLIYIAAEGHYTKGKYTLEKASTAHTILVPDTYDFQYVPNVPFKVIYHNQTDVNDKVNPLVANTNCEGKTKSMEELTENGQETIYARIAKFMKTP